VSEGIVDIFQVQVVVGVLDGFLTISVVRWYQCSVTGVSGVVLPGYGGM